MTNPHVAKAVAASYLEELYKAAGWPVTPDLVDQLVEHTLANVRPDTDGYPVVKIVGKNRLQVEFNLDVRPIEFHGDAEGDGVVDAEILVENPVAPTSSGWPAPTPVESDVDEDNIPEPVADPPGEVRGDLPATEAHEDAPGFRSPWMDKGDEAIAKSAASATE